MNIHAGIDLTATDHQKSEPRMRRTIASVLNAALLAGVAASLSGCVVACPAIAYIYNGPAVLEFSEPVASTTSVAACFGDACTPVDLAREDVQRWEVPQEDPFIRDGMDDGSIQTVRVLVTDDRGRILSDKAYEIPVTVERRGVFGQCGGPFQFEPVSITL